MDLFQIVHGRFFGLLLGDFSDPDGTQSQIVKDRQVRKKIKVLEDHAHFGTNFFDIFEVIGQLDSVDNNLALLMFFHGGRTGSSLPITIMTGIGMAVIRSYAGNLAIAMNRRIARIMPKRR